MITDKDVSIVVQGPVIRESALGITQHTTALVCQRLKELFPDAELIFSTWEGQNVEGILCDSVLFNQDPGATWFNYGDEHLLNNCNRLIVSTLAGIQQASRKYVFKVRSDLFLINKDFLNYFYQFPQFDKAYQQVKNRIIAFSLYSITGHKTKLFTMNRPFHISDWAYFGYKEDLLQLFDIPLTQEPEFSQWFLHRCKNFFDMEPGRLWKMPPEQYITLSFLQKNKSIVMEHTVDCSNNNMNLSRHLLVNNFLVLDQTQFSLVSLKYVNFQLLFEPLLSRTAIFFHTWLKDYYCCVPGISMNLKLRYRFIVLMRAFIYRGSNFLLRVIDGKKANISRLFGYLLKFKYRKDSLIKPKSVVVEE